MTSTRPREIFANLVSVTFSAFILLNPYRPAATSRKACNTHISGSNEPARPTTGGPFRPSPLIDFLPTLARA